MASGITSSFSRSFKIGERPLTITSAAQLPNLEVWYSADTNAQLGSILSGSEVSAWSNAGGLVSHDWNSTGGSRPEWFSNIKNGKGIVRFNGTTIGVPTGEDGDNNERLTINPIAYLQNLAGCTMIILYRSLSTSAGTRIITSSDAGGFKWGQNGNQYVGGFSGATFTLDAVSYPVDTNFHYVIIKFDGTKTGNTNRLKVRLDAIDVPITITGTVSATTSTSAAYFFGGCEGTSTNNVSNFFIGDLGEVLIFTRPLNDSETLAIEDYLSNKWAI